MHRHVHILVLSLAALLLVACGGGTEVARVCLGGEPRPFFRHEDQGVERHRFTANGQSSQETIVFAGGEMLTVSQVGCDTIIQTFEMLVDDAVDNWPFFKATVIERFQRYGRIDARLYPFDHYASFLEAIPEDFPIGAPANLAPGLTVRFFKVPTLEGTTWQVRYEQDLTQVSRGQ